VTSPARLLFIGSGTAFGAMTGLALSWTTLPAVATVSTLGGAILYGLVSSYAARTGTGIPETILSPLRRWMLLVALALFIVTSGSIVAIGISPWVSAAVRRHMTFSGMLACLFIADGAGAVIVAELLRATIARMAQWPDRMHFAGVGVIWVMMFTFASYFLARAWPKLG
jgi:hypothetical protein